MEHESQAVAQSGHTEGVRAFSEKRPPAFRR